jgi:hypothetical protein
LLAAVTMMPRSTTRTGVIPAVLRLDAAALVARPVAVALAWPGAVALAVPQWTLMPGTLMCRRILTPGTVVLLRRQIPTLVT